MRHAHDDRHGRRLKTLIVVLRRAGLRIQEALSLTKSERELPVGLLFCVIDGPARVRAWLAAEE